MIVEGFQPMKGKPNQPNDDLLDAIRSRALEWVEIYKKQSSGPELVKSMLFGIQTGIRRRQGTLCQHEHGGNRPPQWVILSAYGDGLDIAEDLPSALIDCF